MSHGRGRGLGGVYLDNHFIGRGTSRTDHLVNAVLACRGSIGVVSTQYVERCALLGKPLLRDTWPLYYSNVKVDIMTYRVESISAPRRDRGQTYRLTDRRPVFHHNLYLTGFFSK